MASESFFYDSLAYQHVKSGISIPIDEDDQSVVTPTLMTNVACAHVQKKKWECSSQCEQVTITVVDAILTLKAAFDSQYKKSGMP